MSNKLNKIKLDHNSFISLHIQLHNQLRQHIISGRWQNGDRIPSELQWAKHLGISRTTVRIALQRAEVEGLIKRTAGRGTFITYSPHDRSSSRLIGYSTHSFHSEIHNTLLSSVETVLRSAGYHVVFINADNNEDEITILEQLIEDNVCGLLLWPNAKPTQAQKDLLQQYQNLNIPFVFIDRMIEGIVADYVASDNYAGTYAMTNHLIELGHRHIVHLMPNMPSLLPITQRHAGYVDALAQHNLPTYDAWMMNSPDHDEFYETDIYKLLSGDGAELTNQVVEYMSSTTPTPTAIVCANDILAIITTKTLIGMGYRVPEDISVGGFDDISLAAYMTTPLTTVAQDAYEIGRVAAQMLLLRLDGDTSPPKQQYIPTRLQARMSTAAPLCDDMASFEP